MVMPATNCPVDDNEDQVDTDGNGVGDLCQEEDDRDGDGVKNDDDNCPDTANTDQSDVDKDSLGDVCDPDADNDGNPNETDNCWLTAPDDQLDTDSDGQGDICDTDDDNDGVPDPIDNCQFTFNPGQIDSDGDGKGDACEDICPAEPDGTKETACDCFPDLDSDDDGLTNCEEHDLLTNPNKGDTDDDLVKDGQEVEDGSNPLDKGSNIQKLGTRVCAEWNGFLGLFNFFEHLNVSSEERNVNTYAFIRRLVKLMKLMHLN